MTFCCFYCLETARTARGKAFRNTHMTTSMHTAYYYYYYLLFERISHHHNYKNHKSFD